MLTTLSQGAEAPRGVLSTVRLYWCDIKKSTSSGGSLPLALLCADLSDPSFDPKQHCVPLENIVAGLLGSVSAGLRLLMLLVACSRGKNIRRGRKRMASMLKRGFCGFLFLASGRLNVSKTRAMWAGMRGRRTLRGRKTRDERC